ncbi:MAG: bifunctional phosphopantothenoylcysteine decarboxylase/phosphopantothenate--cysteine ligase CoaBC [Candidatus Diapherotrites archaeon]
MSRKKIVLALTGSVAVVRSFDLVKQLQAKGFEVEICASDGALELIGLKTLEHLIEGKVLTEASGKVEYLKLFGKKGSADLLLIAPATANTLGKIANGVSDSIVTLCAATALGSGKKILAAPAMHLDLWNNPVMQENLGKLKKLDVQMIAPKIEEGKAKAAENERIVLEAEKILTEQALKGKKFLVTAGATVEELDPVRILTNKSSGKMGLEIAKELYRKGGEVKLIHNLVPALANPLPAENCYPFKSFAELENALLSNGAKADALFHAAAVGDFEVKKSRGKISSTEKLALELQPRGKLVEAMRKKFPRMKIVGFKAETNLAGNALEKKCAEFLKRTGLQLCVGNDVAKNEMGGEENEVVIVSAKGKTARAKGRKGLVAQRIVAEFEKIA